MTKGEITVNVENHRIHIIYDRDSYINTVDVVYSKSYSIWITTKYQYKKEIKHKKTNSYIIRVGHDKTYVKNFSDKYFISFEDLLDRARKFI